MSSSLSGRRAWRALTLLVVALIVAAAAFWAGRLTLRPPASVEQTPVDATVVGVVEQEIGRVINLTTRVSRSSEPLAVNALAGVVTAAAATGEHGEGDILYVVGQTPVVLVEGSQPFWRDLAEGVKGTDVEQLQSMLVASGHPLATDGDWGARTTAAVKDWQRSHGLPPSGSFPLGSLVAAPELPIDLTLDVQAVRPAASLAGGEVVVRVPDGVPRFEMELTATQAELVTTGTGVVVQHGDDRWAGVVEELIPGDDGVVRAAVTSPDGGLICGEQCAALSIATGLTLLTQVEVVPPQRGPVVPLSSVATEADGSSWVQVDHDGSLERRRVEVRSVADGLAVVRGVRAGEKVRVFADTGPPRAPGGVGSSQTGSP